LHFVALGEFAQDSRVENGTGDGFDEQRNAAGARHEFADQQHGKRLGSDDFGDKGLSRVRRQRLHFDQPAMRAITPAGEFRPRSRDDQNRKIGQVRNHFVQNVERRGIGPVQIFDAEQDGQAIAIVEDDAGERFDAPLASLRGEHVNFGIAAAGRDGKNFRERERAFLQFDAAAGDERLDAVERIVGADEPDPALQHFDERVQRAVHLIGRAFGFEGFDRSAPGGLSGNGKESRFSDACLASQQQHAAMSL
jgi:hypothetical protein